MAAMMRQTCKQILTMLGAVLLLVVSSLPLQAQSVISTIVSDPLTGVAIEGYDPVSYFTGEAPQLGTPEFEFYWAGVPWYFASAANRDVFMRAPDVYAPQYGGHCEMSLARGYLSDGKAAIYAIVNMRLYLFYSAANREAFLLSPDKAMTQARSSWTTLSANLNGPQSDLPTGEPVVETAAAASDHETTVPHAPAPGSSAAQHP